MKKIKQPILEVDFIGNQNTPITTAGRAGFGPEVRQVRNACCASFTMVAMTVAPFAVTVCDCASPSDQ